ncbi:diaminopimelate epimerase [soil metagenome]
MRFTKMHGLGNDYVYVDGFHDKVPGDPVAVSRIVSDRHFGIGSDGLILILPSTVADARMRMFNADGSESEMCGNGLRCVSKFVYDHGIARKPTLKIETGRGVLSVDLEIENSKAVRVKVDMGEPILQASDIPTTLPGNPPVNAPLTVNGKTFVATCVSMGNPHVVIYDDLADTDSFGPLIEVAPEFPRRVNVHFVKVHNRGEITMRTWERGSGITLACGTGACSVAVAGVLSDRTDRKILAHLPGGDLNLEWNGHVFMTGPATEVYSGEIDV